MAATLKVADQAGGEGLPFVTDAGVPAGGKKTKRRPRHQIQELERLQELYSSQLQALQQRNELLTRSASLLARATQVREHQIKLMGMYGVPEQSAHLRIVRSALPSEQRQPGLAQLPLDPRRQHPQHQHPQRRVIIEEVPEGEEQPQSGAAMAQGDDQGWPGAHTQPPKGPCSPHHEPGAATHTACAADTATDASAMTTAGTSSMTAPAPSANAACSPPPAFRQQHLHSTAPATTLPDRPVNDAAARAPAIAALARASVHACSEDEEALTPHAGALSTGAAALPMTTAAPTPFQPDGAAQAVAVAAAATGGPVLTGGYEETSGTAPRPTVHHPATHTGAQHSAGAAGHGTGAGHGAYAAAAQPGSGVNAGSVTGPPGVGTWAPSHSHSSMEGVERQAGQGQGSIGADGGSGGMGAAPPAAAAAAGSDVAAAAASDAVAGAAPVADATAASATAADAASEAAVVVADNWYLSRVLSDVRSDVHVKGQQAEGYDLRQIAQLSERQILDVYEKSAQEFSAVLFQVEQPEPPQEAMAKLLHAVEMVHTVGTVMVTCNPLLAGLMGHPVRAGMEPASEAHWEGVVEALRLSGAQVEDLVHLGQLRLQWMRRAQQEELSAVSDTLTQVLKEMEQSKWRVELPTAELRKAELMTQLPKVARSRRWVLVLLDELLKSHVLTVIQVARLVVHSYPYLPSACGVIEAVGRMERRRRESAADGGGGGGANGQARGGNGRWGPRRPAGGDGGGGVGGGRGEMSTNRGSDHHGSAGMVSDGIGTCAAPVPGATKQAVPGGAGSRRAGGGRS